MTLSIGVGVTGVSTAGTVAAGGVAGGGVAAGAGLLVTAMAFGRATGGGFGVVAMVARHGEASEASDTPHLRKRVESTWKRTKA